MCRTSASGGATGRGWVRGQHGAGRREGRRRRDDMRRRLSVRHGIRGSTLGHQGAARHQRRAVRARVTALRDQRAAGRGGGGGFHHGALHDDDMRPRHGDECRESEEPTHPERSSRWRLPTRRAWLRSPFAGSGAPSGYRDVTPPGQVRRNSSTSLDDRPEGSASPRARALITAAGSSRCPSPRACPISWAARSRSSSASVKR